MAEVIPESISASPTATSGEKRMFRLLRDALQPDDDFIVWYEPKIGTKDPDFVIWGQDLGLLIAEVKDWSLSQLVKLSTDKFHVRLQGAIQAVDSPLTQGRKAYCQLMDRIKDYSFLVHQDGDFKGQPKFPIGHCAVFTGFTRADARTVGTDGGSLFDVLPDCQCLFKDDIEVVADDENVQRVFSRKLKGAFKKATFQFDSLNHVELKALRHALWPEVRIVSLREEQPQSEEDMIRALDLDQERIAKSIGEGHRLLKGVVGSGKTLVLACRASYLAKVHPDWKILVVCYNIATAQYLRAMLKVTTEEDALSRIKVSHFHGLVKELTAKYLGKVRDATGEWESGESWDVRVGSFLREVIESGKVPKGVFEAILIDEGQDFRTDWMQGLIQLLKPETDSLLFCYDAAQNVFGRATPDWKSAGIEFEGKHPLCLRRGYRTTQEILQFATRFAGITKDAMSDSCELGSVLFPEATERRGPLPQLIHIPNIETLATYLATQAEKWLAEGSCTLADIGFLYAKTDHAKAVAPALKAKLGEEKVYWVTENQTTKGRFDISSPSVKLTSFESSKGLEFRKVVLIGLEDMPRTGRTAEEEKCIAYVALTRAQHELQILYMRETPMIKHCLEVLKEGQREAQLAR